MYGAKSQFLDELSPYNGAPPSSSVTSPPSSLKYRSRMLRSSLLPSTQGTATDQLERDLSKNSNERITYLLDRYIWERCRFMIGQCPENAITE